MSKPVCVVIGVGPKNGAAFARKFAAEGYAIALLSRSTDLSSTLAAEIGDAKAYACDVTDPDSIAAAFDALEADLGPADTVLYNAGSGSWGNIEELSAEQFEGPWRVNALGLFLTAKRVVPGMVERAKGSIVVTGATASLRGKPFTTGFAPAKAAQLSLAQAMARHLGPKGIHVSLMIIDGGIGEDGSGAAKAPDKLDPSDIAHSAYHLATQPKSAWTFQADLRPLVETW
jgi:NAD(P)-dependent dehydrogenase (short-subunit alcohol dehydrogenase family)